MLKHIVAFAISLSTFLLASPAFAQSGGIVYPNVVTISTTAPITGGPTSGTAIACPTCVTSAASLANGGVVLGTAGTQAAATNTQLTFAGSTLTVGLAGTSSGILAMPGSTSGTATFTAPAVAGTVLNPVVSSNAISAPYLASLGGADGTSHAAGDITAGRSTFVGVLLLGLGGSSLLDFGLNNSLAFTMTGGGLFIPGGGIQAATYSTNTNCASSGGTCGSAAAGRVSIAAAATTVTVATTAVTANSEIFIQEDSTLGTALSVTCNTTIARTYSVTTRTAATSFVITTSAAPVTNPACLSYRIVN